LNITKASSLAFYFEKVARPANGGISLALSDPVLRIRFSEKGRATIKNIYKAVIARSSLRGRRSNLNKMNRLLRLRLAMTGEEGDVLYEIG